jgi:hypothetical protein
MDAYGRTVFKLILKKQDGTEWTGFIWLRMSGGGACEQATENQLLI